MTTTDPTSTELVAYFRGRKLTADDLRSVVATVRREIAEAHRTKAADILSAWPVLALEAARLGRTSEDVETFSAGQHPVLDIVEAELTALGYRLERRAPAGSCDITLRAHWDSDPVAMRL